MWPGHVCGRFQKLRIIEQGFQQIDHVPLTVNHTHQIRRAYRGMVPRVMFDFFLKLFKTQEWLLTILRTILKFVVIFF